MRAHVYIDGHQRTREMIEHHLTQLYTEVNRSKRSVHVSWFPGGYSWRRGSHGKLKSIYIYNQGEPSLLLVVAVIFYFFWLEVS